MRSDLKRIAALAVAGMLLGSRGQAETLTATSAKAQVAAAASSVVAMDHQFVMKTARGGNAEISMGRLALERSSNAAVKSFARRMIRDHTAAAAKLASIVAAMDGAALPAGLSTSDGEVRAKLAQLSGAAFDAAYLQGQVAGHQKMAALMQKEAASGANVALKSYALATLPTVRTHLSLAQRRLSSDGRRPRASVARASVE